MPHAVRCPRCQALSQVGDAAVGAAVACPNCGGRFRAVPLPPPRVAAPVAPPAADPYHPDPEFNPEGLTGVLLGLSLLPLGIPLVWLAVRLTLRAEPVFSLAAPVAVAVGLAGLAVGVGLARGWGHAARVRAQLALAAAGYLVGAVLFAAPRDWPAAARKVFGPAKISWKEFKSPDGVYSVRVPGPRPPAETPPGPVPDWNLRTFTASAGQPDDRRGVWAVRYTLADGVPPGVGGADDAWFAAVREAVVAASGGELTAETPVVVSRRPARELRLTLPDRVTSRVVRVVRAGDRLVYAAAEGLFLSGDGDEVRTFLGELAVK